MVKGSLGPDCSALWVEHTATHAQAGNKLPTRGDAVLNRGSTVLLEHTGAKSGRIAKVKEILPP